MTSNSRIAACFSEMAVLLELAGENPFRVRAYERAAAALSGLPKPLSDVPQEELLALPGIGKGLAAHVAELLAGGEPPELAALRKRFPKGLLELTRVPGLGPKRARLLFTELGIASMERLRDAARAGKLRALPGFGPKLEESLLKGLEFLREAAKRRTWWDARLILEDLLSTMKGAPGAASLAPAGSFRRGCETVGGLDLLCAARDGGGVVEFFTRLEQVERVLAAGPTQAAVRLKSGIRCGLRVVPPESFGAALQYFTGSKAHNAALRELARRRGFRINEYGLFRLSDKELKNPVAGADEAGIYRKLGLQPVPPELREGSGELEAAAEGRLPELVRLQDIRGDFHNHSSHTDGRNTLEEMARAAEATGWEWVALGDHSRSLRVAKGLSIGDLRRTIAELERVRERVPGVRLMRSMEVDVLKDGTLDYPDEVLARLDVVIGSVHSAFGQSREEMTRRLIRAASNPRVHLLGHLSGRLLGRREPYAFDAEAVLAAGARQGAAFEINGQPQRQDLRDVHARRAAELGASLAVTTDAHAAEQFRYMELAVLVARRAWLTRENVLNCLGYRELRERLKRPGAATRSEE